MSKAEVNRFLDSLEGRIILISNSVSAMDPSISRRFDLILKFEEPSEKQLLTRWKEELLRYGLEDAFTPLQLKDISRKFRSNFGIIAQAARLVAELPEDALKAYPPRTIMESILSEQLGGKEKKLQTEGMETQLYDITVLNTSVAGEGILKAARRWQEQNDGIYGLKMMFYGITGGGKTQLARYLARELSVPLHLRLASDLLGPFVGQTEGNIRKTFEDAAEEGALLVIDEADSLLSSRGGENRRWENSMVNEFLTNIESYPGLLIISTNLIEILDSALLRRFPLKVEFRPLTEEGKKSLMEKYFPEQIARSAQLSGEDITPGDFGTVKARQKLFPEVDVIQALKEEASARKSQGKQARSIGFMA